MVLLREDDKVSLLAKNFKNKVHDHCTFTLHVGKKKYLCCIFYFRHSTLNIEYRCSSPFKGLWRHKHRVLKLAAITDYEQKSDATATGHWITWTRLSQQLLWRTHTTRGDIRTYCKDRVDTGRWWRSATTLPPLWAATSSFFRARTQTSECVNKFRAHSAFHDENNNISRFVR